MMGKFAVLIEGSNRIYTYFEEANCFKSAIHFYDEGPDFVKYDCQS